MNQAELGHTEKGAQVASQLKLQEESLCRQP